MVLQKIKFEEIDETYRNIFHEINDSIFIQDIATGKILHVNKTLCSLFGYSQKEIVNHHITLISAKEPDYCLKKAREIQKKVAAGETLLFAWKCRDKFGRIFWTEVNLKQIFVQDKKFTLAVVRDISDRKASEQILNKYQKRLRSLASQLTLAEERARRHLATMIHDTIGHSLAITNNRLEALLDSISSKKLINKVEEIQKNILETIQYTRSLISEISSPTLYELGLVPAIALSVEHLQEQGDINAKFITDDQSKPLNDDISVLLFQAVRELIVNVIKHAKARNIRIIIQRRGKNIQIIVEDDGIGFPYIKKHYNYHAHKGFGLFSIKERLNHLGGELKINTTPGKGTKITLIAPLSLAKI